MHGRPARHLTVRNVSPALGAALEAERTRRGTSLNATVLSLLEHALGVGAPRTNGLGAFAGRWTEREHAAFTAAVAPTTQIDDELWR